MDDFIDVFGRHVAIPYRFRIHDHGRTHLALIKTSGFIGAHPGVCNPAFGQFRFELAMKFGPA
jgi:hypothetical protein